jgi:hypothetical protein
MPFVHDLMPVLEFIDQLSCSCDHPMIHVKRTHTIRVALLCDHISRKLRYGAELRHAMRMAGLWHDLGRFIQIRDYGVSTDIGTIDHAAASAAIIPEARRHGGTTLSYYDDVIMAVQHHSDLHAIEGDMASIIVKILMDADKLDNIRLFIGANSACATATLIKHGVSSECVSQFFEDKVVDRSKVQTVDDQLLWLLSWCHSLYTWPAREYALKHLLFQHLAAKISDPLLRGQVYCYLAPITAEW